MKTPFSLNAVLLYLISKRTFSCPCRTQQKDGFRQHTFTSVYLPFLSASRQSLWRRIRRTCCRPRSLSAAPPPSTPLPFQGEAQSDLSVPVKGLRHLAILLSASIAPLMPLAISAAWAASFETMTPSFTSSMLGSLICSDGVT